MSAFNKISNTLSSRSAQAINRWSGDSSGSPFVVDLLIQADHITIHMHGAFLQFAPLDEGLEITQLNVMPGYRGQGLGTLLMGIFFELIDSILGDLPQITVRLECKDQYAAERQVSFYQRFDFAVVIDNPTYKLLTLDPNPLNFF